MAETRQLRRGFAAVATTEDPGEVWRRWTEPATWGTWDRGLRRAELDGPFVPGARGVITGLDGRRSVFMVREVVPGQRVVVDVPLPGAAMTLTRTLGTGAPTPVEHRVTFSGLLGGPWAAVLGRRFRPLLGPTVDAVAGARDGATPT
ncbi:SRPBCC family protein [Geodermatophilus marinus]|uniref:hypothetical protein n=1 Tax=Geodermatophilus sp. LHW52908 TaxID=2303986 RepID=UPI000E3E35A3|nr:hypothetical protein [Geodermatophilus sp. LHW52908]RFU22833.1 hypothetical protein D0Z06_02895 [Geodermatophilus sp. LHW52908]